jgi:hypothetical protein
VRDVARELAARLLAQVIRRTPVGQYPKSSGKKGGTLRRGWTGEQRQGAEEYAASLPITKTETAYEIEIINPVLYASYVEFGHRTRDHKGWVPGKLMVTISERTVQAQSEQVIAKALERRLARMFR